MSSSSHEGPICGSWITGADVAACGEDLGVGSDVSALDDVAYDASVILNELSGRQFPGDCIRTIRPCRDGCGCWAGWGYGTGIGPWPLWGWGYDSVTGYWSWIDGDANRCGCGSDSSVTLAGWPVQSIVEVKIDGAVLNPSGYRLDERRKLVRLDTPAAGDTPVVRNRWPRCQNIALDDDQPGTWSVTYVWGGGPPALGQMAAAQLARELWKACQPGMACALPSKVTKVVKQGVTYDRIVTTANLFRTGATGLSLVDAFVATVNPLGKRRRNVVWTPDRPRPGRRVT